MRSELSPFLVSIGVALASFVAAEAALAQPAGTAHAGAERAVGFDEALALTRAAPEVRGEARALAVRARGDATISSLTANPQLYIMPGWRLAPSANTGPELQASIVQPFDLGGLAGARRTAARRERTVLDAHVRARALERRLTAAHDWLFVRASEEDAEVLAREREAATALVDVTTRLAGAGERTSIAVHEARVYLAEVTLRVVDNEGFRHDLGLALAASLADGSGRALIEPLATRGAAPQPDVPAGAALARMTARADTLPAARLARLSAIAEHARAAEARASSGASLQPGVYVQRDSPGGFVAYGMLTYVPALFERGQRASSVAEGEAERLEGDAQRRALDARVEIAGAVHEVEHQREREALMRETLVPELTALVALEERAFAAGESMLFRALEARRRSLDVQRRLVDARRDRLWAEVKLWLLLATLEGEAS